MISRYLHVLILPAICLAAWGCDTPPDAQQLVLDAYAAYNTGQDEQAKTQATRFLQEYPSRPEAAEAHLIRGLSHFRQKEFLQAKLDLTTALEQSRQPSLLSKARFVLGEIALRSGNQEEAIEHYRSCLEQVETGQPPSAQAHYRLGTLLLQKGQFRQADVQFSRLMYLFPDSDLTKRARRLFNAEAWSVQAGLFDSSASADSRVSQLTRSGLHARKQEQLAEGELVYAVLVGRFPTAEEAQAILPEVRKIAPDAYLTVDRRSP